MDAPTFLAHTHDTPARRLAHLYFSPVTHCPALCPFGAPRELFLDDYSEAREDAAADHCGKHCGTIDGEPVCLRRLVTRAGDVAGPGLPELLGVLSERSTALPGVDASPWKG